MQFFGYSQNQMVFAEDGIKGRDYRCKECNGILRIKEGPHRRRHFFHLSFTPSCRQALKDGCHLATQKKILETLPAGEAFLEKRFLTIQRIADIAWPSQKIVFEIQRSPITLQEVKARNDDYACLGFEVIWVLHDKRFNRRSLSAAEAFLRERTSFFTNIDRTGKGMVYDQFEELSGHLRTRKGPPLIAQLNAPRRLPPPPPQLPALLQKKYKQSSYIFKGDLLDRILKEKDLSFFSHKSPSKIVSPIKIARDWCELLFLYLLNKLTS